MYLVDVAREEVRSEPHVAVVGDGDGLLLLVKLEDGDHRAEDLLLEAVHPLLDARQDRRLVEEVAEFVLVSAWVSKYTTDCL